MPTASMTRSMNRRNRMGKHAPGVFCDGVSDIRRWKARKRAERFVNRVGRRTVVLAASLLLALPVIAALVIIFWPVLSRSALIVDVLRCVGGMAAFLFPCVALLIPVRFLTRIPAFIFRKLMHCVAFAAVTMAILTAGSWQAASLTFGLAAIGAFAVLSSLENEEWYGHLLVQKTPGEVKRSLTTFFLMVAALMAICWGVFGQQAIAATAILMWGTGDAAAALVGIPFGRHKVRWADGKKSWEGSAAMLAVSFAIGLCMLLTVQKVPLPKALLSSCVCAFLGTATELFSPSEYDTVTVPIVIAAALLLF